MPQFKDDAFVCPHCDVHARMDWSAMGGVTNDKNALAARCHNCKDWSIWVEPDMVYPDTSLAPRPDKGMSETAKGIYDEAASISVKSPRGAAALLRLAIEHVCIELEAKGKTLNDRIGWLVKERSLSPVIQRSLDSVRVIGNNAVHPGTIDLDDQPETVAALFALTNMIVRTMITEPNAAEALFDSLPDGAKDGVERRDTSK